jgi:hypothetical protein
MTVKVKLLRPLDGTSEGSIVEYPADDAKRLQGLGVVEILGKGGSLRDDGPTVAEYVAAGYRASGYPPRGYASRSTTEEIAAEIANQAKKAAAPPLNKKATAPPNKAVTASTEKDS